MDLEEQQTLHPAYYGHTKSAIQQKVDWAKQRSEQEEILMEDVKA